jgi:hypothetical protein
VYEPDRPPAHVESSSFASSAPSEAWSPPERSFSDERRDADRDARGRATPGAAAEPAASSSGAEAVPVSSDERQAG